MADQATNTSLAVILLPVIVGGVIGVAGGFFGPWFLERRKEAAEKRRKRAEKFEELVAALYEHEHWLMRVRDVRVYGETADITVSPLAKVHAISSAYFPEFEKPIAEIERAARQYEIYTSKAGQKRLAGEVKSLNEGSLEAFEPYWKKFIALMDELRAVAKKEFQ